MVPDCLPPPWIHSSPGASWGHGCKHHLTSVAGGAHPLALSWLRSPFFASQVPSFHSVLLASAFGLSCQAPTPFQAGPRPFIFGLQCSWFPRKHHLGTLSAPGCTVGSPWRRSGSPKLGGWCLLPSLPSSVSSLTVYVFILFPNSAPGRSLACNRLGEVAVAL